MVGCVSCGRLQAGPLCPLCRRDLGPGPSVCGPGGLEVRAAFAHRGVARTLVHHLKYRGLDRAAVVLGAEMARHLPATARALVPVPRARIRRWWYGIDPAMALADVVAARTGVPVVPVLEPAMWWRRHAPADPGARVAPRLRRSLVAPVGSVLVDDVYRTGSTLRAAVAALGRHPVAGLVATAPSTLRGAVVTAGEAHHR